MEVQRVSGIAPALSYSAMDAPYRRQQALLLLIEKRRRSALPADTSSFSPTALSTPVHKQVMIPAVSAWDGCCIQLKPYRLSQRPEGLCTPLHIDDATLSDHEPHRLRNGTRSQP
ncbi:hypothetical protein CCMSSC00406_0008665 [Pleurotus cornucopiae]|uniref:Uncharacterized protein n=1 Tax=Pleurotus cornucopiae TaxID=5321 RepID=A0ACB7JB74_PLECO|nr:hypothetical protein CCMSSC00406_0008665 [Pleurotus cornucopiae]